MLTHNCLDMLVASQHDHKTRGKVRAVWVYNGNLYFLVQQENGCLKQNMADNWRLLSQEEGATLKNKEMA